MTEENIQARIRGNLLMALSNKFGWLVLTTGNKSEIAKGRGRWAPPGASISETPDKQVAGVAARGFETAFEQQGIQVVARSYGLTRSGKVYLLTLSSSEQDAEHAMTELDEILASWVWS